MDENRSLSWLFVLQYNCTAPDRFLLPLRARTKKAMEIAYDRSFEIYCEGKSAVVQCDFPRMISPGRFSRYVLPSLTQEASYLDHCVYHYDGPKALAHIDAVLGIKEIDCIQWVPGDGQPRTIEWMDLLKKIQAAGKSLWIYDWTPDEIKMHFKELELNKVAFSVYASSQDEADALLDYVVSNSWLTTKKQKKESIKYDQKRNSAQYHIKKTDRRDSVQF